VILAFRTFQAVLNSALAVLRSWDGAAVAEVDGDASKPDARHAFVG
jgi:hypothetical protein